MKMSDKGVDSSEIVMLPSLQKRAMVTGVDVRQKNWFLRAIVVHSVWNWLKKSHFTTLQAKRATLRFQYISLYLENSDFWLILKFFWGRFSNSVLSWKSVLKGKNIPCANAINPDTIITTGHEFSELYRRQGNFHLSFFLPSLALCSFAYGFFGSINLCLTCCRDP